MKEEALRMALEALEGADMIDCDMREAITAIKEALAQPEQEPVLWMMPDGKTADKWALQFYGGQKGKPLYTTPPALTQPEQEPLAWISTGPASMIHWTADKPAYGDDWVPLYTTPPQRKPLTLSQKQRLWSSVGDKPTLKDRVNAYGLAIEAAHDIKE